MNCRRFGRLKLNPVTAVILSAAIGMLMPIGAQAERLSLSGLKDQVDENSAKIGANSSAITTKQQRVTGVCPPGRAIREINPDGSTVCEIDSNTTYGAGDGLNLSGTTFSADTDFLQKRVDDFCAPGYAIRVILADGTVDCRITRPERASVFVSRGEVEEVFSERWWVIEASLDFSAVLTLSVRYETDLSTAVVRLSDGNNEVIGEAGTVGATFAQIMGGQGSVTTIDVSNNLETQYYRCFRISDNRIRCAKMY